VENIKNMGKDGFHKPCQKKETPVTVTLHTPRLIQVADCAIIPAILMFVLFSAVANALTYQ
jgi:hypothetical protein